MRNLKKIKLIMQDSLFTMRNVFFLFFIEVNRK
jgi:hypothetical protein